MELILTPFSALLLFLYNFLNSYGLALIAFALIVKVILFYFSLKAKKSMIQMNLLQGKMQQLQKQYGKDKARYNQEVQKLYEKEKINPMGGCLWSLVPMIVLILLYYIIREPISYLMHVPRDMIETVATVTNVANTGAYPQIFMAREFADPGVLAAVQAALGEAGAGVFSLNFDFLGIDLSQIPNWKFWDEPMVWSENFGPLTLVVVSVALSVLSMWVSQRTNKLNKAQSTGNSQADRMTKQMMVIMPIMSVWIGFVMPAGLCLYWIANSLFTIVQELICSRILKKDYEKAIAAREEQERLEKEEIKRQKAERAARIAAEQEEAKKNKGKKKSAAPKPAKKKESTTEEGRVGIRPYARGRSYDPDRFGGPTPYHDPNAAPIPETAPAAGEKAPEAEAVAPAPEQEAAAIGTVAAAAAALAPEETAQTAEAPEEELPDGATAEDKAVEGEAVEAETAEDETAGDEAEEDEARDERRDKASDDDVVEI